MAFLLAHDLESAATILAGTLSEKQRQAALEAIVRTGTSDAARLLMDLFHLTPWGPHRRAIVRTLGRLTDSRTCEFLYLLAVSDPDLTIGREAVLALGQTGLPQAQEILISLARRSAYPFRREAVHALRAVSCLVVGQELQELFADLKKRAGQLGESEHALLDTVLLVLAGHGVRAIEEDLVVLLRQSLRQEADPSFLHACLLAAAALGGVRVRDAVACLDVDDRSVTKSLRDLVMTLMEQRPVPSIEDAVLELSAAVSSMSRNSGSRSSVSLALSRLAPFSDDDLRLACGLLSGDHAGDVSFWLEAAVALRKPREEQIVILGTLLRRARNSGPGVLVSFLGKALRECALGPRRESRQGSVDKNRWRHVLQELGYDDCVALACLIPDVQLVQNISQVALLRQGPRGQSQGALNAQPPASPSEHSPQAQHADALIVKCINALVAQSQMTTDGTTALQCLDVFERLAMDRSRASSVRGRAIRAMGQVAFMQRVEAEKHEDVVRVLDKMMSQVGMRDPLVPSLIHALSHLPSGRALGVLNRIIGDPSEARAPLAILELALVALANFPRHVLEGYHLPLPRAHLSDPGVARLCLRLLGLGVTLSGDAHDAQSWLVREALVSRDFSDVILALDAVHVLTEVKDWDLVVSFAAHEHEAIRSLALERLFRSRRADVQNRIVDFLQPGTSVGCDLLMHCFDVFEVDELDPPLELASFLLSQTQAPWSKRAPAKATSKETPASPFHHPDVRLEALGVAEQIVLLGRKPQSAGPAAMDKELQGTEVDLRGPGTPSPHQPSELERIDASLRRDLALFDVYSETLKTVLRNAELPFSHPEIFRDSVDKSTAIIEFVKSIDLLLQERIGGPLFLDSRSEVLARLQSRVARLGLHDPNIDNARAMRILGIDHVFTSELFPSVKLSRLVQSILAGRFVSEQVRILDGLKGWAVFLVVFARSHVIGGNEFSPILEVSAELGERVTRLAWEMILLQERRNIAAHRGTIIDGAEILSLREQSVFVLGSIDALCPPSQRARVARGMGQGPGQRHGQGAGRLRVPA